MQSNYPVIKYNNETILDISRRFILERIENYPEIWVWYTIKGFETVENIAYDYYGNCDFVWIILCTNNIDWPWDNMPVDYTPFSEYEIDNKIFVKQNRFTESNQIWLLDDVELQKYIYAKYPEELYVNNVGIEFTVDIANRIHHFYNKTKDVKYPYFEINPYINAYKVNNYNSVDNVVLKLRYFLTSNNLFSAPPIDEIEYKLHHPEENIDSIYPEDITYTIRIRHR